MIKTDLKDLSVKEIVHYIKQEVIEQQSEDVEHSEEPISNINPVYIMMDFTKYYDEQFIDNACTLLLNTTSYNEEKAHYLEELRSGNLSKTEIVILLHYSEKGKKQNIIIKGSKKRYIMTRAYSLPIIGSICKTVITLLTLPKLLKRLNFYENGIGVGSKLNTQNASVSQNILKDINHIFQNKADENTLLQLQKDMDEKLLSKADESTLLQLQKDMDEKLEILDIPPSLEVQAIDFLGDAIAKFPHPIETFKDFQADELYYSLFESTFYNHKVVLEKQKIYLDYIPTTNSSENKHLDIGCGRGEFLTLLKKNAHYAMGIDINSLEVKTLNEQGFDVLHSDLIAFLQTTKQSFSSISALQVIEHIDYDILKEFVKLSYDKITKNGVLILETINPHNKVAFNSFYMDETHKRPLPPEMVAFILQYAGFKNIKFRYTSPMPPEFRSKENQHINYHDYAVIGYKI